MIRTRADARRAALAAAMLAFAACGDASRESAGGAEHGSYGGTLVIATTADADVLFPPYSSSDVGAQVNAQIFERLAYASGSLDTWGDVPLARGLARSWSWSSDSLAIAFHLRPGARWHDGQPVTARDVHFTFELLRDPSVGASVPQLRIVDSLTVRDSLTTVFWFSRRHPEQLHHAATAFSVLPAHLLDTVPPSGLRTASFTRAPVGSGRFRFSRWVAGQLIEVVADTLHDLGRPNLDRIIWTVAPDYATALARLETGEADFLYYVQPRDLARISRQPHLDVLRYGAMDYAFLAFNLRSRRSRPENSDAHPVFGDAGVRRAIAMAIDRRMIVENVLDSLGVVPAGPFVRAQATADTAVPQIPHDPAAAERLLDSLGWRRAGSGGMRSRDGRPLRFGILVPTSSANRMRVAVLVQEMLRGIGVRATIESRELSTFLATQAAGDFDAALGAWQVTPSPESVRQTWSGEAARAPRTLNYGRYQSAAFDALLDSAAAAFDPATARHYYRLAYARIVEDAPAIFLYEPVMTAAIHSRVRPAPLLPGAWWTNLADWYVLGGNHPSDVPAPTNGSP